MNLRGIRIEYFITGSFSLIWLLLLAHTYDLQPSNSIFSNEILISVIAISTIYVLGMLIDFIGRGYVSLLEKSIPRFFPYKKMERTHIYARRAAITVFNPELSKQIDMRSSRDRIARGSIINSFMIGVVLLYTLPMQRMQALSVFLGTIVICLLLSYMWMRFQSLSYRYVHECELLVEASKKNNEV